MKDGDKLIGTVARCALSANEDGTKVSLGVIFDVDGDQVWGRIHFTEKSMELARKSLKSIGFDPDAHALDEFQRDPKLCVGNKAEIVIEDHEYNGKTSLRVKWINALPKPVEKNILAGITRSLRLAKKRDDVENESEV